MLKDTLLKEKVTVTTLDDNKTYTYFNALELDIDNDEPVGTLVLKTPYNEDNLKYWSTTESPVVVNLSLNDDTHNSFIGRVEKVSLKGYSMFIYLQNAGWKFKNKVPKEFRSGLVAGQHVTDTFQAICEGWGLQFCYSIKALYEYTFAGDGYSIQKGSTTITSVPDEFKLLQNQEAIEQAANQTTGNTEEIDTKTQNEDINSSPADNTNTEANKNNSSINSTNTNTNTPTLTNTTNSTDVDGTNVNNTEQQTEETDEDVIKKLQDKYKEEFEKKIRDLIKGDQIYKDSDVVTAVFDYDAITIEPKVTSTNTTTSTPTTDTSTGTTGTTRTTGNSSTNTTNTSNTNTGTTSNTGNTATTGAAGSSTGGNGTNYPGSGGQCPTTETISFTGSRSCCCSSTCKCTGTVTQSFYNYCPQCNTIGKLEDNPKGVAEGEITCGACDADYCICCGGCKASATSCSDGSIALIPSGTAGSGTQTTGGAGSTYIKIPDKTFWGLIKQICGATDSIFVIANNCAYLLQYKDFYNYADKFNDDINVIEKQYISKDNIQENWANTGFYNTVIIDEDIKVQYDDLVNLYGESAYHYSMADILGNTDEVDNSTDEIETLTSQTKTGTTDTNTSNTQNTEETDDGKDKTDEEMTIRSRAIALLAQHVRDYGMGLRLSTLYNAGITPGSFIKVDNPISITKTNDNTTKTLSDNTKTDDKKTDESKIKTDENLEQYFVQGYTIKWNNKHTLQMDVELKYGPDTPEDPINATITFSGGGTSGSGSEGNTCNLTDYAQCTNGHTHATSSHDLSCNNWEIQPDGSLGNPTADDWCKIGVEGTNYAQATANMSAAEIYMHITSTHPYDCYGDNKYADCTAAYSAQCLNCGDMARLLKCCFDVANIPCYIIHLYNHFMCGVCIDGTWKTMDGTRKNRHKGSNDTNNCNFEAGEPTQPSGCSYC